MIDYNARLSAAILGVSVALVQMQPAQALTKVEVSKVAQSVTVMIQDSQSPQTAGSGIIIKREGKTYTVLTAHHVVRQSPNYQVMTPDKKMNPIVQGSIKPLPGVDPALVQFKSGGAYGVAKMGDSAQNPLGSASFVAGFPGTTEVRSEPEYYFTSGEIAANESRPKVNKTLALRTPSPSASSAPKADDFFLQSEQKYKRGDYKGSISDLERAIQINPKYAKAYFGLGFNRNALGDKKGEITDLDQAIRLDPKLATAYNNRGFARG
jgi:hypothetical protein